MEITTTVVPTCRNPLRQQQGYKWGKLVNWKEWHACYFTGQNKTCKKHSEHLETTEIVLNHLDEKMLSMRCMTHKDICTWKPITGLISSCFGSPNWQMWQYETSNVKTHPGAQCFILPIYEMLFFESVCCCFFLKWCLRNLNSTQCCLWPALVQHSITTYIQYVLLCACRFTCRNKCLFFVVSQGSYGVVKLAYNEDDDKHYVSQGSLVKDWNTAP